MEMITVTAKTVEDAITQASLQLGVSSDRIQYEVVEKGSAGVLGGLFGSKPAVIRAKKIETVDDKAVDFLNSVFDAMGLAVLRTSGSFASLVSRSSLSALFLL